MNPIIFYHGGCPDGFGAAYMLGEHLGTDNLVPLTHGTDPPEVPPGVDRVFLVDYANVPVDWLDSIMVPVTILDHHRTASHLYNILADREDWAMSTHWLDSLTHTYSRNLFVLSEAHSGIGLVAAWIEACGGNPDSLLWFWHFIEDRDLWRFTFSSTPEIYNAVISHPYTREAWREMNLAPPRSLYLEGRAIGRYRDQLIAAAVKRAYNVDFDGHTVPTTQTDYSYGSDAAGQLALQSPSGIGAYIIDHGDHIQIGLRSRGDGPNVAEIAEWHGGGGHVNAAGLRVDRATYESWIYPD